MDGPLSAFIKDERSETPTLQLLVGCDIDGARHWAAADLSLNAHHLAVEVYSDDQLLFTLERHGSEVRTVEAIRSTSVAPEVARGRRTDC